MKNTPFTPGQLWWHGAKDTAWERVVGTVDYIWDTPEEKQRRADDVDHARLYGNRYFKGFGPFQFTKAVPAQKDQERLRANICKPVVDTTTAIAAGRNRPKATLLTNSGDWSQKRRAKRADRFVEGVFREAQMQSLGPLAFRSAGIFGTGVLKGYHEHGRIKVEHVLPCELVVDPIDGQNGRPRSMYQVRYIDRSVLRELFGKGNPELDAKIVATDIVEDHETGADRSTTSEPVRVVEAWHLPSGPKAKDGRHCIAIHGATLLYEDWDKDRFPFVFFRWSAPLKGFWGRGLIEEIKPLQLEVNTTLTRIKQCLHLMAVPRIFVPGTAKVIKSLITNEVGSIIPYSGGTPPIMSTPPAVPQELFEHLRWCIAQAFEQAGISQMSAGSKKPAGLESGEALRTYNDIGSERVAIQGRDYETMHMDLAELVMDLANELDSASSEGFSTVFVRGRQAAQRIKWKDVVMDRDSYVLQVHPTSMLPRDAPGRTATVESWIAAGWLDEQQGKRLLDFPDLDSENDLTGASRDFVDMQLELILEDGEGQEPDPAADLEYAFIRSQQTLALSRLEGAPEDRLDLIRNYIEDVKTLLDRGKMVASAQAMPGPADMAAAGAPPAPPMDPSMMAAPQPQGLPLPA